MKYGDKIIEMQGIIVELHDGCVAIDLKGRLGYMKVPRCDQGEPADQLRYGAAGHMA